MIVIPKPQFLSKKLKFCGYPSKRASAINSFSDLYKLHKGKKRSRIGAEGQVCVEKTEDSRLATAKKEIASASQANTSIMEKACTESSVKKFPHPTAGFGAGQAFLPTDPIGSNNVIDLTMPSSSEERTPYLFGNEANSIVEIMFKTSDGSLVPVTDELLQNLQKDGLQYQVMDEDGKLGEVHELQLTKDMTNAAAGNIPLLLETLDLFGNAQTDSADITNEPCKAEDNAGALIDQNNVAIPSLDTEELNESYSIENLLLNAYAEMQPDHSEVEMQMMDVKGSIPATASTDQKEDPSLDFSPDMFDLFGDAQKESVDITTEPCKLVDNAGALIDPENVLLNAFAEKQPDHSKVEMQMTDDKGSTPATASTDQKEDSGLDFSPDMFFADW
ncbi:unnamed protein product [Acanthoscelides obtectus]|uniref:Uncharacterized protein n=1 Tax=Acanthoscelides obtectus TaxID=200917 RepID=A0A9P0JVI2_ACAOB|nr:unnamed protein product [Acanthoscelides obtectus]CAK1628008.1 hypothetical protein AOBTE_LOCUS4955 [Acanthoscelides obtectus]